MIGGAGMIVLGACAGNVGSSGGPTSRAFDGSLDDGDRVVDPMDGFSGFRAESAADTEAPMGPDDALAFDASDAESGVGALCITAGTELCDDFESGTIEPRVWRINKPSASAGVTVDSEHAHGGKYAAHVKVVPGQQSTAQITEALTFPAKSNAFYTRIFAYFSPDLPSDDNGGFHMGFIIAGGNNDLGHVELALGSSGQKNFLGYSIYRGPPFVEFGPRSPLQVASNRWLCLELFESGEGGTAAIRQVWVDGAELTEQRSTYAGQKPPVFDLVSIGLWQYHPTPILSDMWIDDVRVSSRRIGCSS